MPQQQLTHAEHRVGQHRLPLCLLAHDFEVPGNVGSLFRIADALGVEMLYLSGNSPVPPNGKIRKMARATEQYVPFCYHVEPLPLIAQLKAQGYLIVSLEITSASIDIRQLALPSCSKICLILGSENTGVSQILLDCSDHAVHIPMRGHNSSMNVASACAIAVFEITRLW
jgi:tRNA G18 (ribose-2'-O)-methylase SpoU